VGKRLRKKWGTGIIANGRGNPSGNTGQKGGTPYLTEKRGNTAKRNDPPTRSKEAPAILHGGFFLK